MTDWFADESFWRDLYPFLFPDTRFAAAVEETDKLLALTKFSGGRILDLCCGPGRHCIELARRGFKVTGVDRSPFLLSIAKARAEAAGVQVEWVHEDMRSFIRRSAFDLVLNLFTAFGYFEKAAEDEKVLSNIHESLVHGGQCVIDVKGKESLARGFMPTASDRTPDGSATLIQRHEVVDDWTRIRNEWILIKGDDIKTFRFLLNIYSGGELRHILHHAGFHHVHLYGDLDGHAYGLDARRLIAVARKGHFD